MVQVAGGGELDDEAPGDHPVPARRDVGADEVDVVVGQHAHDVGEQAATVKGLDVDLHEVGGLGVVRLPDL